MSLMPKRVRWRKHQRGVIRGDAGRCRTIAFGEWGIQSLEAGWITAAQLEAARVAGQRAAGTGRVYVRIFPHKPVTSTPEETRMGTGKGEVDYWCAPVKAGTVLLEVGGVSEEVARMALNRMCHKLPVRAKLLQRRHGL